MNLLRPVAKTPRIVTPSYNEEIDNLWASLDMYGEQMKLELWLRSNEIAGYSGKGYVWGKRGAPFQHGTP